MTNYDRARTILVDNKAVLLKIADELLAREVLDADQVTRLVQGLPLEERVPAAAPPVADERREAPLGPGRPAIVPSLNKPVGQE